MSTIEENNQIIAEFMQYHFDKQTNEYYIRKYNSGDWWTKDELCFHESYDSLMPVLEKIELLGYSVEKNFQRVDKDWQCLITRGNNILFQEFADDSIEAMYQAVLSFIEFYNNQKP
jgi:hypothetical protein